MYQALPYQLEGATFLSQHKRGFLWDDMGLGKSAQSIWACDKVKASKVLVLTPACGRINWQREFRKFQTRQRGTQALFESLGMLSVCHNLVTVVPYDMVYKKGVFNRLMLQQWDVIILDEAHYLKEPESKRTQAVYGPRCDGEGGLVERGTHVWPLTGTPVPNNPLELWPSLRALTPDALMLNGKIMDWWTYLNRYCVWKENIFGRVTVIKGRNMDELRRRIAPHALRRKKKDVLPELPAIRISELPLDVTEAYDELVKLEDSLDVKLLKSALQHTHPNELNLEQFLNNEHIATLRRVIGIAKAHAIVKQLETEFFCGLDKIVVMAWHRDVLKIIYDGLRKAGINVAQLHGGTPGPEKQAAVDRFQNDPSCQVFLGQLKAAGTLITLTAASQFLFAEMSWTPGDNEQALMRVHRIGQNRGVIARCAYLPGSIDEAVTAVLRRKTETINQLVD